MIPVVGDPGAAQRLPYIGETYSYSIWISWSDVFHSLNIFPLVLEHLKYLSYHFKF